MGERRVVIAAEQDGLGEVLRHLPQPPKCSTQIRVKRRRAVSLSTSALPSSRSCRMRAPSLWMPRRAMSMASIWRAAVLDRVVVAFADLPVILHHLAERAERQVKLRRVLAASVSTSKTSRFSRIARSAGRAFGRGARRARAGRRCSSPAGRTPRPCAPARSRASARACRWCLCRSYKYAWSSLDLGVPGPRPRHACTIPASGSIARAARAPTAHAPQGFRTASVSAAGPMARRASGVIRASVVRFMKSSTDRPEENRAERAVGSTWFGPPT
jgi:hypothetical protein